MLGSPTGWLTLPDCALLIYSLSASVLLFMESASSPLFPPSRAHARPDVVIPRVLSPVLSNPRQEMRAGDKTPADSTVQGVHC